MSHVFKGDKDLTLEQAARLCEYWGLNEREASYFITLVELSRAGSQELKKILRARLTEYKSSETELKNRISKDAILSEMDRFQFYSEWYYSAIRLLSEVKEHGSIDRIASHLDLPVAVVNNVIQFLLETGLVAEHKGKFKLGPNRTFLPAKNPLVHRHHANWRTRAMQLYPKMNHDLDLAVTSPMTLSHKDAVKIRELLLKTIQNILEINGPSEPEALHVLNVDWLAV